MGPGKPGKSWNNYFIVAFSRTGKSWKKVAGPRNIMLNSSKKYEMYGI